MHLAVAFAGHVGHFGDGIDKHGLDEPDKHALDASVFNIAAYCWQRALLRLATLDPTATLRVLVHSWNVELQSIIDEELRPTAAVYEAPRSFPRLPCAMGNASSPRNNAPTNRCPGVAEGVRLSPHAWNVHPMFAILACAEDARHMARNGWANAGYSYRNLQSQWYSRRSVMQLVLDDERRSGRAFDAVLLTRLDLCPCQAEPIRLERLLLGGGIELRVPLMKNKAPRRAHTHAVPRSC